MEGLSSGGGGSSLGLPVLACGCSESSLPACQKLCPQGAVLVPVYQGWAEIVRARAGDCGARTGIPHLALRCLRLCHHCVSSHTLKLEDAPPDHEGQRLGLGLNLLGNVIGFRFGLCAFVDLVTLPDIATGLLEVHQLAMGEKASDHAQMVHKRDLGGLLVIEGEPDDALFHLVGFRSELGQEFLDNTETNFGGGHEYAFLLWSARQRPVMVTVARECAGG